MSDSASRVTVEDLAIHLGWARRLAYSLTHEESDADDLVQEAWIAGWRKPPAGDRPLRPWLGKVLVNGVRNRLRARRRRGVREKRVDEIVETSVPTPEEVAARAQILRRMAEHFLALPAPYRQVLSMRYYEGRDATAIGLALGVPPGTVRWRIKMGLEQLRTCLDRDHQGDRKRWMVVLLPRSARDAPNPSKRQPWWMRPVALATMAASVGVGTVALVTSPSESTPGGRQGNPTARAAAIARPLPPVPRPAMAGPPAPAAGESCPEARALWEEARRLREQLDPYLGPDTILADSPPNPEAERRYGAVVAEAVRRAGKCDHVVECRGWACRVVLAAPTAEPDDCYDRRGRSELALHETRSTYAQGTPVTDALSAGRVYRIESRVRLAALDGGPVPHDRRPKTLPTLSRQQPLPPMPPGLSPACRAETEAALARLASLEEAADRDLDPELNFASSIPRPTATAEARALIDRVLGSALAQRLDVECRGNICRITRRDTSDPLTAISWECLHAYCSPRPSDSSWSATLRRSRQDSHLWTRMSAPRRTPEAEHGEYFRLRARADGKLAGTEVLDRLKERLFRSRFISRCHARIPAAETVELRLRLVSSTRAPQAVLEARVEIEPSAPAPQTPLARCMLDGARDIASRFRIPRYVGDATAPFTITFEP